SEEKFSKAFHSNPDFTMISRLRDGLIVEVNEGFEQLLGVKAAEAVGQMTVANLHMWADPVHRETLVRLLAEHGRVRDLPAVFLTRNGESRDVLITASTIDLATGKKTLDQDMAVTPRFITAQGDFVAAATTDDKFTVMNMRENTVVWTGPITIKTASVELVQFALARPDRFALVLRTLWPDRPHLERLYLHSFSPAEPEKVLQVQLGKPQESRVPARIGTGERELNLPVWVHGGELYSAVDGLFQTLDIARGTSTNSFTLPGKGPVSLLKVRTDGSALLERADQLVLVKARSGIAWTAPLKDREIRQVTSETVVLAEAYALSALSLTDGKPVGPGAKDLKSMPSVRAATASRIYFNMPDGNYLLENNEVKKVKEYPMLSVHPADRDWLVFTKNESPPGKGSWAAVDADSGKVLWQKLVTRTPEVV
ncbi:MAG: hypothetical protein CVU63_21295, partial [Deltaproteobacteria bacterium HGW-Deltaproteobacteria-20]